MERVSMKRPFEGVTQGSMHGNYNQIPTVLVDYQRVVAAVTVLAAVKVTTHQIKRNL